MDDVLRRLAAKDGDVMTALVKKTELRALLLYVREMTATQEGQERIDGEPDLIAGIDFMPESW